MERRDAYNCMQDIPHKAQDNAAPASIGPYEADKSWTYGFSIAAMVSRLVNERTGWVAVPGAAGGREDIGPQSAAIAPTWTVDPSDLLTGSILPRRLLHEARCGPSVWAIEVASDNASVFR